MTNSFRPKQQWKKKRGTPVNSTGRSTKIVEPHIRLPVALLVSESWMNLSPYARDTFRALRSIYNGDNNGRIGLSLSEAARRMRCSEDSVTKAIRDLIRSDLIIVTTNSTRPDSDGHGGRARTFSFTDLPIGGKPPARDRQPLEPSFVVDMDPRKKLFVAMPKRLLTLASQRLSVYARDALIWFRTMAVIQANGDPVRANGDIRLTVDKLSELIGCNKRTAMHAIDALVSEGFIEITWDADFNVKVRALQGRRYRIADIASIGPDGLPLRASHAYLTKTLLSA